jgi:pimeloyl-ACP methyl ester carboxylesterase
MGWLGQAKAMLPEVEHLLGFALSRYPTAPIFWVGHSAGGPIATALCAAVRDVPAPRLVVPFSAPRAWNRKGAAWFDATFPQTWGIVPAFRGAPDAATRVPPKWTGAHHVGRRIMLVDGRALENLEDWRALEASHPVGWLPSWRILSRVVAGIGIHPIGVTVGVLRRMAESQPQEEIDR